MRGAILPILDAGKHPVANRFLSSADAPEEQFPLVMGQCAGCGLVQLQTAMPAEALVPRVDWISYNEPEGHLDAVVSTITALPGVSSASVIGGVTYKDDTTLARLSRIGLKRQWRLDAAADLGVSALGGLETIQDRLTPARAVEVSQKYPAADLLLARHILEHAYETRQFLTALGSLVKPGGYVLFEVPDCAQAFDTCDYTTLWEEHILYFTPETFAETLRRAGFGIADFTVHPYPYENSLVAIVRVGDAAQAQAEAPADHGRGMWRFAESFETRRTELRDYLLRHRAAGGRIALFGAGHLSCMFANLMGVSDLLECVIDDHPAKVGMFMPGSRLPIRPAHTLLSSGINLCLSTLSPESEEKVVTRQTAFAAAGGRFVSVFPSSRRALRLSN